MSAGLVVTVVVVAVALVAAVTGGVALAGGLDFSHPLRSVRAATTRGQRRRALAQIRSGQPLAPEQAPLVRAVAVALASQGGPALTYTGLTLACVSTMLRSLPGWVLVLAGIAGVGNAAVAVVAAAGHHRGRRFLAAHPDLGAGVAR